MKPLLIFSFVFFLVFSAANAQVEKKQPTQPASESSSTSATVDDDRQQLSSDVQQLKILLNQMRTNLAFVQTTQTPLKHQFELETDAWQVIINQMEQRLRKMERNEPAQPRNK